MGLLNIRMEYNFKVPRPKGRGFNPGDLMKITPREAYIILENCSVVVIDDDILVYPSISEFLEADSNTFLELAWDNEGREFNLTFEKSNNCEVDIIGSSMFLINTEGETIQLTILNPTNIELIFRGVNKQDIQMLREEFTMNIVDWFDPHNDKKHPWYKLSRWQKRIHGWLTYQISAWLALVFPEQTDLITYKVLREQFEDTNKKD